MKKKRNQNRNILFVEGVDDLNVIVHLLKCHFGIKNVENFVHIENEQGVDNLLESIPVEIKNNSELQRFGIVVDADTKIKARWQAIRDRLQKINADVPEKPNPDGTIFNFIGKDEREIRIGIWIMPDNNVPGILEDFLSFLIPAKDLLWDRAQSCVDQIPKKEFAFNIENKDLSSWDQKAKIHTWLAWQEEPGKPFGTAISEKYLDADTPHARKLTDWLNKLFELW